MCNDNELIFLRSLVDFFSHSGYCSVTRQSIPLVHQGLISLKVTSDSVYLLVVSIVFNAKP